MNAPVSSADLHDKIAEIRVKQGDTVPITEIADIVGALMTSMEGDISAAQFEVRREIGDLVAYLDSARREIAAISPAEIKHRDIPGATDELDAVVGATEMATNTILDAAEELSDLASDLTAEQQKRVGDIAARIFEASNFQDITGQRITKVVTTLRHIESKVTALARAFGEDVGTVSDAEPALQPETLAGTDDTDLLNGPQLPGAGNTQEDIDALLASFD